MPIWIFRISCLIGFPLLTFQFLVHDLRGVLVGIICALILIGAEHSVRSVRFFTIMLGFFGVLLGYLIFMLLDYTILQIQEPIMTDIWNDFRDEAISMLVIVGGFIAIVRSKDLMGISKKGRHLKVLDSSILMDGRIVDVCRSEFLHGVLIVPIFVLGELEKLSKSDDPLQKARGRRGLDILAQLQEKKYLPVKIVRKNPKPTDILEKVVKLAKSLDAQIITMNFDMNKIAAVDNVSVLNVNDLTFALKPVVLPGESIQMFIMKDGKEKEQGIGYLDDGTMVVVEDGKRFIGKKADIDIYSILQTPAGRMIFAKIKRDRRDNKKDKYKRDKYNDR